MSNLKVNTIEPTSHKKLIRYIACRRGEADYYETAQVCINGHVITSGIESSKLDMQKFCEDCGKPTIIKCDYCKTRIRGICCVYGRELHQVEQVRLPAL